MCQFHVVAARVSQFRFETTETGTDTSFGTVQNKTFLSVVSLLYQNRDFRNKQKTNRNILIGSIFWNFFKKFRVFPVCFRLFWFVLKQLFRFVCFYTNTDSFDVSIEPKQKVCFVTVSFVSVVSKQVRNTETNRKKQKFFCFWLHETNRCSNRNFLCLFRGHPIVVNSIILSEKKSCLFHF